MDVEFPWGMGTQVEIPEDRGKGSTVKPPGDRVKLFSRFTH